MASYQRRGHNSFLLVAEAGYNAKGNRIRRTKTIRIDDESLLKTKKRLNDYVEKELYKFRIEVESGEYIKPEKSLLNDFVELWEEKYAKEHLGAGTLETHKSHIKNHILPALGHLRLEQIRPKHILDLLSSLRTEKDLSDSTVQYNYRVLRNIFERASEWEFIAANPVAKVARPKVTKRKVKDNVYTEKEVELIFKEMTTESLHWQVFISLALACGFRRGENLGLESKHIVWDKRQISIEQAIVRGEKGRAILKDPKSFDSNRIVTAPKSVMALLRKLYDTNMKEKEKAGDYWVERKHEWIFCNDDGTHFYPTTPTTWWKRFTTRKKLRYIRLHDLRHTSATLLINRGIHAKIISERLGHADIRVTMDTYGHALQEADEKAADELNDLFK